MDCAAIGRALGADVRGVAGVGGGDINEAHRLELVDGRRVFVKTNPRSPPGMFAAEAAGLEWLRAPDALRIPRVLAVGDAPSGPLAFLALEWIESGRRTADFDERLGRGLAALHGATPAGFGLDRPNFIGRLPQDNAPMTRWIDFYRTRRLEAQLKQAIDAGRAPAAMRAGFAALLVHIDRWIRPDVPAARLHGDLWGGNLHVDDAGAPCLIDPAVYGGDREIDLAMMRLFGGFGPRVFKAYEEAWPLDPGADERSALYQLYPLMVHVNLFGGSYVQSVMAILNRYA